MRLFPFALLIFTVATLPLGCGTAAYMQDTGSSDLDMKVRAFLDRHRGTWRDLNVPESDGRLLYDLVLKNRFQHALEIGTSTGHSAVWIAWALSKTGGKLITIEIDRERHREALANFREAGLSGYIDARLGDAHQLVPALEGPFDFVFSDADKEWYMNYFVSVWPKVDPGGCFTAHNVRSARQPGIGEFLQHLKTVRDATTTIDRSSSAGVSITCRQRGDSARRFSDRSSARTRHRWAKSAASRLRLAAFPPTIGSTTAMRPERSSMGQTPSVAGSGTLTML